MAAKNEAPALMAIHPGYILKEEIIERGISQKDLAKGIGMQPSHLNEIIKGKRSINKQVADKLEEALGIPSIDWINLQIRFDYDTNQGEARQIIETTAYGEYQEYNKVFDVKILTSRLGFHSSRCSSIVSFLKESFMLPEPARFQVQVSGLFKKSDKVGKDPRKIMSWILLAKYFAYSSSFSGAYDESKLEEVIPQISSILHSNVNTLNRLEETFAKYGILFGVVKKVDGAAIDGYSFIHNGYPCIVVTTRYDRIDNLAFSVMHELAHIKNHVHEEFRVNLADYDHESHEEKVANAFAANALIPDGVWKKMPKAQLFPANIQRICSNWAESNSYNKWIAIGRLSHETGMYKFKSDSTRKLS